MKILVACEYSGRVRDAFTAKGHDVTSCDFLPTERPGKHYEGDVYDILYQDDWEMMIAHPDCTYLCSSGLHWNNKIEGRAEKTEEALEFITDLWTCGIPKICLENPVGCINTRLKFMPRPQYIQPYNFGEDASKKTGLWLKGLRPLRATKQIEGRKVKKNGRIYRRWSNQTDSGQSNLGPSKTRGKDRSLTYQGIADAMAKQWGC
tara:strand:+ start:680 stop:1294 length:615 start_codon:yes stop_codon:yes gene_type:complete